MSILIDGAWAMVNQNQPFFNYDQPKTVINVHKATKKSSEI